jgi:GNAT superfamily N-acetyltransferase
MPRIPLREFTPADIDAAAALLAARHTRERARLPQLGARLESTDACTGELRRFVANARMNGVVAETFDGSIAAFLFGEKMMLPPNAYPSMFVYPHSISMPVHGHAAVIGGDTTALYRAMYADLAGRWVRQGFFVHETHVTPADPELQEAWVSLGFGRATTAAVRHTGPVEGATPASVQIHHAAAEDIAVVISLSDTLFGFHSESPIFWPFLEAPKDAAREHTRDMLVQPGNAYFVAYDNGVPAGMQTFNRPGFIPPVLDLEGNVYLYEGVVEPDARSGGVGTALLSHSMAWARGQGYDKCTLHFASANPSGGPFWLGHGFVPIEYSMTRHIDERVAWANGWR